MTAALGIALVIRLCGGRIGPDFAEDSTVSFERAIELWQECVNDLAEARRQGHAGWIDTLSRRLAELGRLAEQKRPLVWGAMS